MLLTRAYRWLKEWWAWTYRVGDVLQVNISYFSQFKEGGPMGESIT
jgi:hypothetical protein